MGGGEEVKRGEKEKREGKAGVRKRKRKSGGSGHTASAFAAFHKRQSRIYRKPCPWQRVIGRGVASLGSRRGWNTKPLPQSSV